ncbi:hypothetical protein CC80DRAFT_592798 [Byssothecium circinans]|uniref:DUF2423 domain-containing protein n=1 Tax=Byssothecium circinans TaxID=147558 RepID=A0A6A5TY36_9PLEO|nr:hypothetical protein CC80DRAFT_592798 [Byssothecium circinans]
MAKGLRSSVKKGNRTKLRARVFAPVENARLERIHAKLLETAQLPKPENPKKNEMDIDTAEDDANDASKEDEFPKGLSILTASIPPSLSADDASPSPDLSADSRMSENLYHMLGLSSDIVGFTGDGDLAFAFDPLPPHWLSNMDVDGAAASATTKSKPKDRKAIRKARKMKGRKPKNSIAFPATRGKGALKPFSGAKNRRI